MSFLPDQEWSTQHSFRPLSEERLSLAIRWFEECRSGHGCHPANAGFVPRRLIYVGDPFLPLRLVETGSGLQGAEIKYAALSYCWGTGGGIFTTTFDNIERNKRSIRLGQLPKVYNRSYTR